VNYLNLVKLSFEIGQKTIVSFLLSLKMVCLTIIYDMIFSGRKCCPFKGFFIHYGEIRVVL